MSEPVYEVLGGVRREVPSNVSVAELQSYEQNKNIKEHICDNVIGQSASSENMCAVCTVCTENDIQHVESLAVSGQSRCIITHTKGGQSSSEGGGYALSVVNQFEENLPGKAAKKGDSEDISNIISFVSSVPYLKKTQLLARKFGSKVQKSNLTSVNITPTKRKLLADNNIHTLISSFENTAASHHRGCGESPAKRGRYSFVVKVDNLN